MKVNFNYETAILDNEINLVVDSKNFYDYVKRFLDSEPMVLSYRESWYDKLDIGHELAFTEKPFADSLYNYRALIRCSSSAIAVYVMNLITSSIDNIIRLEKCLEITEDE